MKVLVEVIQRVSWEQLSFAFAEEVGESQVDGAHGAVKLDRAKQLGPDSHEPNQRIQAAIMDGEPRGGEGAVVEQSIQIERMPAVTGHEGVSHHKIEVVDRVDPAEQTSQQDEPTGLILFVAL